MSEKQPEVIIQGDVLFLRVREIEDISETFKDQETHDAIVALGETTGHKHVMEDIIFVDDSGVQPDGDLAGELFRAASERIESEQQEIVAAVVVPDKGRVRHLDADEEPTGEHNDLELPPGGYIVARQRRFNPIERGSPSFSSWMTIAD